MAPTGEALKHFVFIMPDSAMAEEKESKSLEDAPITPTSKVPEQRDGVGEMEKNCCRGAVMGPISAGAHSHISGLIQLNGKPCLGEGWRIWCNQIRGFMGRTKPNKGEQGSGQT